MLALAIKVIIGDNDGPGRELGKKRSLLFGADLYFPPPDFKDVDEWILADQVGALNQFNAWGRIAQSNW